MFFFTWTEYMYVIFSLDHAFYLISICGRPLSINTFIIDNVELRLFSD